MKATIDEVFQSLMCYLVEKVKQILNEIDRENEENRIYGDDDLAEQR